MFLLSGFCFQSFTGWKAGGESQKQRPSQHPARKAQHAFLWDSLPACVHRLRQPGLCCNGASPKDEAMTNMLGICPLSGLYPRARAWQVQLPPQHFTTAMALCSSLGQLNAGDLLENPLAELIHPFCLLSMLISCQRGARLSSGSPAQGLCGSSIPQKHSAT